MLSLKIPFLLSVSARTLGMLWFIELISWCVWRFLARRFGILTRWGISAHIANTANTTIEVCKTLLC